MLHLITAISRGGRAGFRCSCGCCLPSFAAADGATVHLSIYVAHSLGEMHPVRGVRCSLHGKWGAHQLVEVDVDLGRRRVLRPAPKGDESVVRGAAAIVLFLLSSSVWTVGVIPAAAASLSSPSIR